MVGSNSASTISVANDKLYHIANARAHVGIASTPKPDQMTFGGARFVAKSLDGQDPVAGRNAGVRITGFGFDGRVRKHPLSVSWR